MENLLPSYQELESKVENLEQKIINLERQVNYAQGEQRKMFTILEHIPAFICLQDFNYELRYVNQRFVDTFGLPDSQTCYQILRKGFAPCKNCPTFENCERSLEHGCEWNDKEGNTYVIFDNSFVTIDNEKLILKVGVNITDRKMVELQLEQSKVQLQELNATKDKFFSIIAHDLKNAFSSILGLSELLSKNSDKYEPDKIKKFSENIHSTTKNTHTLLENLLEWARSQQGKIPYQPQLTTLNTIVRDCLFLVNDASKLKQISIVNHISEDLKLYADKEMIKTVFRNLLTNAIKYTHIAGTIELNACSTSQGVEICISDNGVGMSLETVQSLFKIGENKSTEGTQGERGTGFGLILCKEFIEKHGGKMKVESLLGKGSAFKFTLPISL